MKKLRDRFSEHICEIVRLMLRFDESERPSFIELAKLVLTSANNTIDSPKGAMNHKEGGIGMSLNPRGAAAVGN